jgi:aminopeptidase N
MVVSVALLWCGSLRPAAAQFQRAGGNPFQLPRAALHYARNRDYTERFLRLVFDVDAAKHSAHGIVTHYLTPLRDPLDKIVFDAGANLKIEACRIAGESVNFQHEKETLILQPSQPLPRGKEVEVEIRYTLPGSITGGGANGVGGFRWIDPNPGDPERRRGFWTQGEAETNHTWIPCYDYPNNKCASETIVTVPEDWEVIGNGVQGRTTHDAAKHTRTFHWSLAQPHSTYLLSLVAGEIDVRQSSWNGIPLYYVVPRGKAALIEPSFGNTPDMLRFYSDLLGVRFPWPKYAQSAVFDFPGGMENVSATTLGQGALTDRRSGAWLMSSLNSHELAHQWFGDLVTCKDWGDAWLHEGFATFMATLYMEHLRGKEEGARERQSDLNSYLNEARRYKHPISTKLYDNAENLFDAHCYSKASLVLHMLQRELGDADFFRGLRYFLNANAHQSVDAHDLERAFAEATGRNVEPFFDQWIFKPGHPVLDYDWKYDDASKSVILHVKQTQDTADGTPIYHLPLTVMLIWQEGTSTEKSTQSSQTRREALSLDQAEATWHLQAAVKPDSLLLDPDHDLLKAMQNHWADSELSAILHYAPTSVDRLEAARKLAQGMPDENKIRLLMEAVRAESDDRTAASLLGILNGLDLDAAHREILRPLLREQARQKEPVRRAAALEALGKLKATSEDTALLRAAALSDTEPYGIVEAALSALGRLDTAANLDVFQHQIMAHSLRDRLASQVVDVLSRTTLDAAAPILLAATKPPHRSYVRRGAVEALETVGRDNAAVHAGLLDLLNTPQEPDLEIAAAHALSSRKDKAAVTALRSLAAQSKDEEVQQAAKDAADTLEGK